MKISGAIDFNAPALDYARKDFPLLERTQRRETLETIRRAKAWVARHLFLCGR
jgi:hypothetical protein